MYLPKTLHFMNFSFLFWFTFLHTFDLCSFHCKGVQIHDKNLYTRASLITYFLRYVPRKPYTGLSILITQQALYLM